MPGIVVLGMHRSGTSAVTRVLNMLGASVGPEQDLLTEYDNPAGHWESKALVGCNDRILGAFGRSWDFPPWLASGWADSPTASALIPDMRATFSSVFTSEPWVWKDPRTCLTFPLWRRVIGSAACVVIVSRHPGAVVESIRRRDGIPRVYGTGLWHHYVRAAVAASAGLPTICLWFEDLVAEPVQTVRALAADLRTLGVDLPGDPGAAAASVHDDLVHGEQTSGLVHRLTATTVGVLKSLPTRSHEFAPPSWREPRWVRPVLFAYRGPWVLRARSGHPLRPDAHVGFPGGP